MNSDHSPKPTLRATRFYKNLLDSKVAKQRMENVPANKTKAHPQNESNSTRMPPCSRLPVSKVNARFNDSRELIMENIKTADFSSTFQLFHSITQKSINQVFIIRTFNKSTDKATIRLLLKNPFREHLFLSQQPKFTYTLKLYQLISS